ncbi:MAG: amidohydrolase family protein [Planctomycetota bacterium]|nr:amidohydrolase family protein [Planctomycetota bacterium]
MNLSTDQRSDLDHPASNPESTKMKHLSRALALSCVAAAFAAAPAAAAGDGTIVLKVGKVITNAGAPIENGTIVIENGRIVDVGPDAAGRWDAPVREYPDLVAFPGFVEALTNRGMDRPNENVDVAPFLDVRDSIDPVNFYFEDCLRWGVTTINVQHGPGCVIGAQGHVVKPFGMTVEQMSVRPRSGIVMAASPKGGKSRATQAQALRRAFSGLRRYLEGVVQEKRDGLDYATREARYQGREPDEETARGRVMAGSGWKVEGLELVPRWEIDEKQEPLLRLVEGKVPAFIYCGSAMDVRVALEVATDNGFVDRTTLVLSSSCWKAADEIAAAGVPVILSATLTAIERDPVTGEEIETFVPGVFAKKGVEFALRSSNASTRSLWYQAAACIGHGMEREAALAAVTTAPARMLGLETRVGTLEKGKDGNVLLFSGDPLSVTSFCEFVFIEGEQRYDRSQDVRNTHLNTGAQPENTAPEEGAGEGDDAPDEDGDEDDEEKEDEDGEKD